MAGFTAGHLFNAPPPDTYWGEGPGASRAAYVVTFFAAEPAPRFRAAM
jgi:hypothetical protein